MPQTPQIKGEKRLSNAYHKVLVVVMVFYFLPSYDTWMCYFYENSDDKPV